MKRIISVITDKWNRVNEISIRNRVFESFFFAKESLVQAKEDCACSRLKITCGLSSLYGLFAG